MKEKNELKRVVTEADEANTINLVKHFQSYKKELIKALSEWQKNPRDEAWQVSLAQKEKLKTKLNSANKKLSEISGEILASETTRTLSSGFAAWNGNRSYFKATQATFTAARDGANRFNTKFAYTVPWGNFKEKVKPLFNSSRYTYSDWEKNSQQAKAELQEAKRLYLAMPAIREVRRFCCLFNMIANLFNCCFVLIESSAYKEVKNQFTILERSIETLDQVSKSRENSAAVQEEKFSRLTTLVNSERRYNLFPQNQDLLSSFDNCNHDEKVCGLTG